MRATSRLIKNCFAILLIVVLIYIVDVKQLWAALSELTVEILIYLGLLSILLVYISAMKWQYFLEALGSRVPVLHLFNLYILGYFVNLLLPSYVGGDVVRSWYAGKRVGQHEAFTATILERYTGFVAMLTMAVLFVWFVEQVTWQIKIAVLAVAAGLIFITFLALAPKTLECLDQYKKLGTVLEHLKKIQAGFRFAKEDHALLIKTLLLSFLFHIFTVVNAAAAAYAVGWCDPPIKDLFVVLPLIMLIGAIPVAPSGLGIQEGAFFFFLSSIGATPAQALGVGIILRAKSYILALVGGLIWLRIKNKPDQESGVEINPAVLSKSV
jgi:glycosyltransferase 2 family protein